MHHIHKDRELEHFKEARRIIDFRFIQTKNLSVLNMVAMIGLIIIPFLIQLFCDQDDKLIILYSLITCFSGSMFFLIQEIIQMKGYKWRYLRDVVNAVDILLHPLLAWYIFFRITDEIIKANPLDIKEMLNPANMTQQ